MPAPDSPSCVLFAGFRAHSSTPPPPAWPCSVVETHQRRNHPPYQLLAEAHGLRSGRVHSGFLSVSSRESQTASRGNVPEHHETVSHRNVPEPGCSWGVLLPTSIHRCSADQ
eukprot:990947-Rhodomonas_salina.5